MKVRPSSATAFTRQVPSRQKRNTVLSAVAAVMVVLLAAAAIFILSRQNIGDPVIRDGNSEDIREAVKILNDSYGEIITLVTAAFGAIAFLITLQKERGREVPGRAWTLLAVGIVLLLLALCLSFAGREEILVMMTRNAVDLNLPALALTRWLSYGCMVLSALFILSFAVEVMIGSSDTESQEAV